MLLKKITWAELNFANLAMSELFLLWEVARLGEGASRSSGCLGWELQQASCALWCGQLWGEADPPCPFFQHLPAWTCRVLSRQGWQEALVPFCGPGSLLPKATVSFAHAYRSGKNLAIRASDSLTSCFPRSIFFSSVCVWYGGFLFVVVGFCLFVFLFLTLLQRYGVNMLTEAFKGKSCSSFFAAVGAFAACSRMQERSIMGQWALGGSAQYFTPHVTIQGDGDGEGAGRQGWISLLFCLVLWRMPF